LGGRGGLNDISLSGSVVPVVSCFFPFPCGFEVHSTVSCWKFFLFSTFSGEIFLARFYRELKTLSIASISWVCDSFILLVDLQYEYELPVKLYSYSPVSNNSITCMSDRNVSDKLNDDGMKPISDLHFFVYFSSRYLQQSPPTHNHHGKSKRHACSHNLFFLDFVLHREK